MPVNKVRRNGSYAPLSAHYYKDDAIDEAGEKAEVLYVRGLAFCADVLSDGFISDRQLKHVGVGLAGVEQRAKTLVKVGLWARDDERGGYRVRSWLRWNRSRSEIVHQLDKDADRKQPDGPAPWRGRKRPGNIRTETETDSERKPDPPPNGTGAPRGAESNSTPSGISPRARTPAPAPRNSTPSTTSGGAADAAAQPGVDSSSEPASTLPLGIVHQPGVPLRERSEPDCGPRGGGLRTTAQTLTAEWIDRCPKTPPKSVIGQVAKHVKAMLDEAIDPDDIRRGMAAWMGKGLHPATLPSVVNEVMNGAARASTGNVVAIRGEQRPSTADVRVAQGMAIAARLEAEEAGEVRTS